jgi:hypothetical protein
MIFNDDEFYTPDEVAEGLKVHVQSVRQSIPGRRNKRPKLGRWLPYPGSLGTRARWTGRQIKDFVGVPTSGAPALMPTPESVPAVKRKPGRPRKAVGGAA